LVGGVTQAKTGGIVEYSGEFCYCTNEDEKMAEERGVGNPCRFSNETARERPTPKMRDGAKSTSWVKNQEPCQH